MKLYLIRHGQTDWNLQGRIQGNRDISLNETGREQAQALARGMGSREVSCIFSSRLLRARQTAEAIGAAKGVPVEVIDGLEEVDFGAWEGMTWEEINAAYPEEYAAWRKDPSAVTPTGGEAREQVEKRCQAAVERLLGRMEALGGDGAVVAHGAILVYILSYLLRNQKEPHQELIVENVSITTVSYDPVPQVGKLLQCNDTSHLTS
ncbi:MAG: histidine phosphatase family protein [Lachnospiraceae bacterium]